MKIRKILKTFGFAFAFLLIILIAAFFYSRSWERSLLMDPLCQLDSQEKIMALTFDDGPSEARTPLLLDLLDSLQVKATFFMLGQNIEKHPDLARQVFEQGHLIGNHSWDHPRLVLKSPTFVKDQIDRTEKLILELGQKEVKYFRPPFSSKYIVLPLVLSSLHKVLVTGTYDPPSEYKTPYDGPKVAAEVIANAKPGSIVYLHDGKSSDPEAFVESVRLIITSLQSQGYRFVRLDEN
ncbi:MAG: polysaccharide deacetylase family protein [Bacteroidia bacterium]|nr:polysaccharide deacetylase family protein [Bacteroidia bacterium]